MSVPGHPRDPDIYPGNLQPVILKPVGRTSIFREKQRGVENSGEGKTYHKNPSPKRFWTPLPMIRFPAPVCFCPAVFLRGNRHRPGKSHFLRLPKLVLEGALYGTFPPPPQNRTIRFAPHWPLSKILGEFDLPGVVPGVLPRMPILRFKTRVAGSWLGIARTEPRNPSDRKRAQDRTCG